MDNKDFFDHEQIFNHILLAPYIAKLRYYGKWSKFHKTCYWIMVVIQLFLGLGLTISLIIKLDGLLIASFAISLNFMLIALQYIQFGKKYKRYRLTEIKIEFLLLDFANNLISKRESDMNTYIISNISSLGKKIERLVSSEFTEHFLDLKELSEFAHKTKIPGNSNSD